MKIVNTTRKTVVAKNCKFVTAYLELIFGLHWLSNPPELLFKTRFGIHTFLLQKPIDVVVLDDGYKVVKLRKDLLPNSFFFWNPKYQWLLELTAGSIKSSQT